MKHYFRFLLLAGFLGSASLLNAQQGDVTPPPEGETAQHVLQQVQSRVDKIRTLKGTLEMDEKDKDHKKKKKHDQDKQPGKYAGWEPEGRKVKRGPFEISRGTGAWVSLQRKKSTKEYIANRSTIWIYDHHDKEAQFIPTSMPVLGTFVNGAFNLNIFVALEPDSIKLKGTQSVDGEPCWVISGKSPSKLSMAGVDQTKIKLWISQRDGIPRLIRLPSEEDLIIRLKGLQINQPVSPNRFNWSPPPGVDTKNIFGF